MAQRRAADRHDQVDRSEYEHLASEAERVARNDKLCELVKSGVPGRAAISQLGMPSQDAMYVLKARGLAGIRKVGG